MGISERKQRDKEELREKIVSAARELFLQYGIENTSMRMIADKIEYSPATIYLHFKDKNELFYVIMDKAFFKFFSYFSRAAHVQEPMERLHHLGRLYLQFAREHPFYYDLMFVTKGPMSTLPEDDRWENGGRSHAILTTTVQDCIDAGYFKGHEPKALSLAIWSSVHGLATLKLCDRLSMYQEDEADELMSQALETLNKMLTNA